MSKIKVEFVSEWAWTESGNDEIRTPALLDLITGKLEIETSDENCDDLIREYIEYKDNKYPVEPNEDNEYVVLKDDLLNIIYDHETEV